MTVTKRLQRRRPDSASDLDRVRAVESHPVCEGFGIAVRQVATAARARHSGRRIGVVEVLERGATPCGF